jgi:hypothetical protein
LLECSFHFQLHLHSLNGTYESSQCAAVLADDIGLVRARASCGICATEL